MGGKKGRLYRYELTCYYSYIGGEPWDKREFEVRVRYSVPFGQSATGQEWRIRSLIEEKLDDLNIQIEGDGWTRFQSVGYRPVGKSNTTTMIYYIEEKQSTHFRVPKGRKWSVLGGPDTLLTQHEISNKVKAHHRKQRQTRESIRKKYRARR